MPYQVTFPALAFQRPDPNDPTGKTPLGDEVIVKQYGRVPAWVPEWQVGALVQAGMVSPVAPAPVFEEETPGGTYAPLEAPLSPDGYVVMTPHDPEVTDEPAPTPTGDLPPLPKDSDNKETWERYAVLPAIAIPQGEAEAMTKVALVSAVKSRYATATR